MLKLKLKMNLNKTLLHATRKFHKFRQLIDLHNFTTSKSCVSAWKPSYRTFLNENQVKVAFPERQVPPFCLYSSAANKEQILRKHPDFFISVPNLEFEDVVFDQPVSHNELCDALQACNSVKEQMLALCSTLALSPDDVERRAKFIKVIEALLKPFFGKIRIQMFGSTVNGFGFKGCDIDMSFETFGDEKEKISYLEVPDVPMVSEVMCGKVTPEEMSLLPRKEQLLFIHTVLLEFYKETAEPIIFISAHVPLVRFYHDKYNLKCDLSCRNTVAFANTKLLYLFGKLDDRVIPLMMVIRYWAKHVGLIGKGLLFNTYTISMIVIHFFQTRNPPILPSAEHILSISDSLEVDDMNDETFLEITKSIPPSKNTQTLDELLRDFFFFYLYFDFTRVICPLIGGSIPRETFFPNRPSKKFKMNTICVQDPMLVSHNIADLVDFKTCKKFFQELMTVCKLFQEDTFCAPSPSKWGLLTLLDKPDEYHLYNVACQMNVSFSVPLFNKPIIDKYASENTNFMTAKSLLFLLEHILLFECKTLQMSDIRKLLNQHDERIEAHKKIVESVNKMNTELREFTQKLRKQEKKVNYTDKQVHYVPMLEEFEKFNSEHTLLLGAECRVLKNSWLGRDFVALESFPNSSTYDLIEKERYVSEQVSKQNEANAVEGKTKPFMFFYECYLSPSEPESSLLINFRPHQRTNFNPILGIFLKEYIPKLIKDLNEVC